MKIVPLNPRWVGLAILLVGAAAWGQGYDGRSAPMLESKVPWQAVVCTIACLLAVCAIAFKNARRTHLD
jgi:hypothetical protein